MAAPDPQPRAVETPLPFAQADAPALDPEIGVSTSDDSDSGWDTPTPARSSVTRTDLAASLLGASASKVRYLILRSGIHRRRGWKS